MDIHRMALLGGTAVGLAVMFFPFFGDRAGFKDCLARALYSGGWDSWKARAKFWFWLCAACFFGLIAFLVVGGR